MSYNEPPPPPQYGGQQPMYGGQPPAGTNKKAITSLVLGVLGLVCCGIFTCIPAIFLALSAKKEIAQRREGGAGLATAGLVLGIIATVLGVIGIILFATGAITFDGTMQQTS